MCRRLLRTDIFLLPLLYLWNLYKMYNSKNIYLFYSCIGLKCKGYFAQLSKGSYTLQYNVPSRAEFCHRLILNIWKSKNWPPHSSYLDLVCPNSENNPGHILDPRFSKIFLFHKKASQKN